MYWIHTLKH